MQTIRKIIQYTPDDLKHAIWAYQAAFQKHMRHMFLYVGLALITAANLFFVSSGFGSGSLADFATMIAGAVFIIMHFVMRHRIGKIMWKKQPEFHKPILFQISDELIRVEMQSAKADVEWSAIVSASVTSNMILLYPNKLTYYILPLRVFNEDERQDLIELVNSKVKEVFR